MKASSNIKLYPHQITAVKWMKKNEQSGHGGLLFDCMGLGKTIDAISLIVESNILGKTLIVVPLSVLDQWKDEFEKRVAFQNEGCVHMYYGLASNRNSNLSYKSACDAHIIITTYNTIVSDVRHKESIVNRISFTRMILDEVHIIRNPTSQVHKSITSVSKDVKYKWGLTGTPFNNCVNDLMAIYSYIGYGDSADKIWWGRYKVTLRKIELNRPMSDLDKTNLKTFEYIKTHLSMGREKSELQLPQLTHQTIKCVFTSNQLKAYRKARNEAIQAYKDYIQHHETGSLAYTCLITKILRLRQICVHPFIPRPNKIKTAKAHRIHKSSTKFKKTLQLIRESTKSDVYVIFSQWTTSLDMLSTMLTAQHIKHLQFDGRMNKLKRKDVLDIFNEGAHKVLLVSTLAGGVGLNLITANKVILIDPMYNPYAEQQALNRVHRIGQTQPVTIYRLTVENTVEDWMCSINERKYGIYDMMMGNHDPNSPIVSNTDVKQLFQKFIMLKTDVTDDSNTSKDRYI